MIASFSLERVNRAPASFDPNTLLAFQERYMQALPADETLSVGEALPADEALPVGATLVDEMVSAEEALSVDEALSGETLSAGATMSVSVDCLNMVK